MIQVVRVRTIIGADLAGVGVLHDIHHVLHNQKVKKVETARVYRLEGINEKDAKVLAEKLLCEEINQAYTLNEPILFNVHPGGVHSATPGVVLRPRRTPGVNLITIEIAYKPGVMNSEVASILKAASDLGIKLKACDSSREYGLYGDVTRKDIEAIIKKLTLLNETIEHVVSEEPKTLLIKGTVGKTQTIPLRKLSDKQLMELSKDKLFLNLEELKAIQNYFNKVKRDPTDCELETLAQTWSEHSGHKTFKAKLIVDGKEKESLIARIKKEALKHKKHIVSAFVDNSGVMDFYDGWAINGKGETHNAPSAIEPYGGAMTGSGGVFRDIVGTGQGAKAVISTDIFCFAPPDYPTENLPPGTLPPRYLLKRVVAGVRDYGNRMGIPTNNGSIHFHEDFRARPTVFVGAYGITPKKYAKKGVPKIGDLIVVIGGQTGRDGIHGATFSSGEMTERTINVNVSAVQIGNAIEEKRMFDAILEARDENIIAAMQDVGGGGFSSAIGEMGEDVGVTVDMAKAPLKYAGLAPWEIWVSESQERMILVISPKNLKRLLSICKKYNVEATVVGKFDGSKKLNVYYGKEKVCDLEMEFLHRGLPQRVLQATAARKSVKKVPPLSRWHLNKPKSVREWIAILEKVVSHGNICSKEPIVRMYDHTVQGTNALPPFTGVSHDGPNDAVVIKPLLDKPYGMIVSHGLNPILNRIDPYWGSIWAGAEAIANYVAVGGNYKDASLINNYIWPFPDSESLWSLDRSVDAVCDFMKALSIPVISGKDSLSSTYRGPGGLVIKIPPVLCMSVFGKIPDVTKTVSSDFKKVGSTIILVGQLDLDGMGGSTYFDTHGILGDKIPRVDLKGLPKVLDALYKAIQTGNILSAHDVSEGGIITAIFEMCLGGNVGVSFDLSKDQKSSRPDYFLFNETAGCFIVEVENESLAKKLFKGVPFQILGKTQKDKSVIVNDLFEVKVDQLEKAWKKPMQQVFS